MEKRKRNIRKRIGRKQIENVVDEIRIMIGEDGEMIHPTKIGGRKRRGGSIRIGREEIEVSAVRDHLRHQVKVLRAVQLPMMVMIGEGDENGRQMIAVIKLREKRKNQLPDQNMQGYYEDVIRNY